jgi:hypothetical protein
VVWRSPSTLVAAAACSATPSLAAWGSPAPRIAGPCSPELAATVVVGCCLGLGTAVVGTMLAYGRIDPVPDFQPEPLLRPALVVMALLAAVALVVTALGAVLGQERADRDDPMEVLRAGV